MEYKINPKTEIGSIQLAVRDLSLTKNFYQSAIGLREISQGDEFVSLGIKDISLLTLVARPHGIRYPHSTGLFHFAILLPSRAELGRWLSHFLNQGNRLEGAGDHLVSEALYLTDPEGNGIEIYADRPREMWQVQAGQIKMDTLPVDLASLLKEANRTAFDGLPVGTKIGHIHLRVSDLTTTLAFYRDLIGFDLVASMPGAGFLSAGGYHHHIGMNTWQTLGARTSPPNSLGLINFEIKLPDRDSLKNLEAHLDKLGIKFDQQDDGIYLQDPAGIRVVISPEN